MELREKIRTILYRSNKEDATDKILALIEQEYKPVELELLTDEELVTRWGAHPTTGNTTVYKSISEATIAKNQKGQLYRRKGERHERDTIQAKHD